ncbi:MAG TPA: hypothetical protein VM370_07055 [Candidatus Thermoplasmatota archaeon]|nr:hypothetical protein [Candidatus Thermoplasmatota archaeon]
MAWLRDVLAQKDSLIRGGTLLVGGLALVLAGTLIGLEGSKWAQVAAGTLAVTGIVVMFLGFFVYVVPPLLPAK